LQPAGIFAKAEVLLREAIKGTLARSTCGMRAARDGCDPGEGTQPRGGKIFLLSTLADTRPRRLAPQGEKNEVRGSTDSTKSHRALREKSIDRLKSRGGMLIIAPLSAILRFQ
jgi:hypothetical protein